MTVSSYLLNFNHGVKAYPVASQVRFDPAYPYSAIKGPCKGLELVNNEIAVLKSGLPSTNAMHVSINELLNSNSIYLVAMDI